jgi:hypothetical protein
MDIAPQQRRPCLSANRIGVLCGFVSAYSQHDVIGTMQRFDGARRATALRPLLALPVPFRRPLSRAYRPLMRPILKVALGSRAPVAERTAIVSEGRRAGLKGSRGEVPESEPQRPFRCEREMAFTGNALARVGTAVHERPIHAFSTDT